MPTNSHVLISAHTVFWCSSNRHYTDYK